MTKVLSRVIMILIVCLSLSCMYADYPTAIVEENGVLYGYYDEQMLMLAHKKRIPPELIELLKEHGDLDELKL